MKNYLDFEKEIKALEQEVDGLKSPFGSEGISEVDTNKIEKIQDEINEIINQSSKAKKFMENREILKTIFVEDKIINFIG